MIHCPKTQTYWTPSCPECVCEHSNESAAAQEAGKEPGRASGDMPAPAADLLRLCDKIETHLTCFSDDEVYGIDVPVMRLFLAAAHQNVRRGELLGKLICDLRVSLTTSYLFDSREEPLDAYGKRLIRVILSRLEREDIAKEIGA